MTYKGKNISDVLDMNIEEAITFFENHESIRRKLETLYDVGLGYMKLGQASTTLSGGEAQRVKLATELSRRATAPDRNGQQRAGDRAQSGCHQGGGLPD